MHECLSVVYFEPLKLDRSGAVTRAWTMYDQTSERNVKRTRMDYSGSGAQHLPAHSVALRSSTKAKDSRLAAGNSRQTDITTTTIHLFTTEVLTNRAEDIFQGAENCVSKTSLALIKLTHSPRSPPKPWCLDVNSAPDYVTFIDLQTV